MTDEESSISAEKSAPIERKRSLRPRMIVCAGLGAVGGFAWTYFVGCPTGSCALQANPYLMTGFGLLMGASLGS